MAQLVATPQDVLDAFTQLPGEKFSDFDARADKFMAKLEKSSSIAVLKQSAKKMIINIPYADGYAHYRVESESPFTVCHIPHGDGWAVSSAMIRGLRLQDVVSWSVKEEPITPRLVEKTLTDGSKTYDILLESGNTVVTLGCVDRRHANILFSAINTASVAIGDIE